MRYTAIASLIGAINFPGMAIAESTQTTDVRRILSDMASAHASLEGMTITMRGAIGTLIGDQLYFKNDDGQFKVQFDAGRNARKLIEGCELEWFGWANSKCIHEVDAEIKIEEAFSFSDGGEITLIIYDIR